MIQLFRPYVGEDAIEAASAVLRSGWIGLGPKTAEFEAEFARYVGSKYAVAVNSATAALHLAMVVSGVRPKDEVLTVPLTFVSTNHAIRYVGADPVFVDVSDRTLNMDLSAAEKLITPATRAIVVVHYGGNPADLDALYDLASRRGIAVIEDAAHACGASFRGRRVGSFGLTCFSFHAVKNLPIGDGGMVTTDDEAVYRRLMRLRWMGIDRSTFERSAGAYQWEYGVGEIGFKYHMNDVAAAVGLAQLKHVDEWNDRRRRIAAMYREGLEPLADRGLRFVEETPGAVSARHLFAVRVPERDRLVEELKKREISAGVHYMPNHLYEVYRTARRGELPVAERAYRELVSLPLHLLLTDDDVRLVCNAVREVMLGPSS